MAPRALRWFTGAAFIFSCGGGLEPDAREAGELHGGQAVYALDVSVYTRMISWSEYECLWSEGVRHVIVGTQDPTVAAQQLDFAVDSGMTVDLYVYLYWDASITAQVQEALSLAEGRPVGRLWLDVEEDPDGRSSTRLIQLVREGLDACGTFPCGIYTGAGFWISHMGNTELFSDVPLWYARYEEPNNLDDFESERFGGWTSAIGKQYSGSVYVCGTGRWRLNVDENYWLTDAVPTVSVDRTFEPYDSVPPAPPRLFPAGGIDLAQQYVKLMAQPLDGALEYQFEVLYWNGTEFRPYYSYGGLAQPTWLQFSMRRDRTYRFRARARNEHGFGPWSDHAQFNLGRVANPPPLPGAQAPGGPPPAPSDVPTNLSPEDGARITTTSVRMSCAPVDAAQRYEFHIQYLASTGEFRDYYTYSSSAPERTFYPLRSNPTYRWRVRALRGAQWTDWSAWAAFDFAPP
jgi:hypothetical protein